MPAASLDEESMAPLYMQMVADMRRRFAAGEFPAGTPLPSSPVLEHDYGLSRDTVRRAMYELRDLGYVVAVRGTNWRASDPLPGEHQREVVQLPPGARVWTEPATDEERRRYGLPRGAVMQVVHHKAVTRRWPADRVEFQTPWRDPNVTHDQVSGN